MFDVTNATGEVFRDEIKNLKTFIRRIDKGGLYESKGEKEYSRIFIVSKGRVSVDGRELSERGLCAFLPEGIITFEGLSDSVLLEINVKGDMGEPDKNALPYFLDYSDAETYKEDCKSEKTTSRFLLKQRILPNIAIGSVETTGPDEVGAHEHPYVEQLFYSFSENSCRLVINGEEICYPANTLYHIPLGSIHGVKAYEGDKIHYVWIDYILDKNGLDYMDEAHQL